MKAKTKTTYKKLSTSTLDKRIARQEKVLRLHALDFTVDRIETGFSGASSTRRWSRNWGLASGTADEMMLEDTRTLRDRSQDLYRNSSVVHGIIDNITDNAIGVGLRLQSTIDGKFLGLTPQEAEAWQDMVERKFHNFAKTVECDASRKLNFYQQQELAFRNYQIDGECFALLPRFQRGKEPHRIKIQLHPAYRVANPWVSNNEKMRDGIKFNDRGEPQEYYFQKREGYFTNPMEYIPIPAFGAKSGRKNVLHIYRPYFIGQSRGTPFISTVIEDVKQLDRYGKNELTNAAVSSLFTGFIKSNRNNALDPLFQGTTGEDLDDRPQDYTLDAGAMYRLNEGEDVVFANPNRPNSGFRDFNETYLMLIGMATGIPFEVLVKRFNSSFTASKAARIEAWRHYLAERRQFVTLFNDPIYREWLIDFIASGGIDAPGFFDDPDVMEAYLETDWVGDSQGQIDPVRETQAAVLKIQNGLSTYTEEAAKNGMDFDKNVARQRYERERLQELGMLFSPDQLQASVKNSDKLDDEDKKQNESNT